MSTRYLDRDGAIINKAKWEELRKDESYCTVKAYDNGVVQVKAMWVGRALHAENTMPEYWPIFILLVKNYNAEGNLVVDPVDSDKTFPTMAAVADSFTKFLTHWTQSTVSEAGELVEVGNTLEPIAPPVPPDPNRPATVSEDVGDEGAW